MKIILVTTFAVILRMATPNREYEHYLGFSFPIWAYPGLFCLFYFIRDSLL